MKSTNETITMRKLIDESEKSYGIEICPGRDENITVTIPQVIIEAAAEGLLEDRNKIMGWFGLDVDNTVSEYGLSVNSQDIINGRLKNAKHFMRTLDAWYDKDIQFCGLMYLQPNGKATFSKDDWWHMIEVMLKYGFSYAILTIGEMSADKNSVTDMQFYLMDFFGTVYSTTDQGEIKTFIKDETIGNKFMHEFHVENEVIHKVVGSAY